MSTGRRRSERRRCLRPVAAPRATGRGRAARDPRSLTSFGDVVTGDVVLRRLVVMQAAGPAFAGFGRLVERRAGRAFGLARLTASFFDDFLARLERQACAAR